MHRFRAWSPATHKLADGHAIDESLPPQAGPICANAWLLNFTQPDTPSHWYTVRVRLSEAIAAARVVVVDGAGLRTSAAVAHVTVALV